MQLLLRIGYILFILLSFVSAIVAMFLHGFIWILTGKDFSDRYNNLDTKIEDWFQRKLAN